MKWALTSLAVIAALGCGATTTEAVARRALPPPTPWPESASLAAAPREASPSEAPPTSAWDDPMASLTRAAERASPGARRVLETTRAMLDEGTVVRGSCFTWVNAVYRRAGGRSQAVFRESRRARYADASALRPGDWVFFINHSFGDVTHSAIFVAWTDENARTALMVS